MVGIVGIDFAQPQITRLSIAIQFPVGTGSTVDVFPWGKAYEGEKSCTSFPKYAFYGVMLTRTFGF
jgi:hypothetical protein